LGGDHHQKARDADRPHCRQHRADVEVADHRRGHDQADQHRGDRHGPRSGSGTDHVADIGIAHPVPPGARGDARLASGVRRL
jgi:hypothetical protein